MENTGNKNPRLCRANTAASGSGQQPSGSVPPPLSHISLHCFLILGVWSTFRGTRELTPRRSPFRAAGLDVGRRLDDGELLVPNPPLSVRRPFDLCAPFRTTQPTTPHLYCFPPPSSQCQVPSQLSSTRLPNWTEHHRRLGRTLRFGGLIISPLPTLFCQLLQEVCLYGHQ